MEMFLLLITTVIVVVLSEIADKTQLIIFALSLKYRSRIQIFLGIMLGVIVMDGGAVVLGSYFGNLPDTHTVKSLISLSFIGLGLYTILKKEDKKKKHKHHRWPFMAAFLTMIVTEIGDKSQIAVGLLSAEYQNTRIIFIGMLIGFMLTTSVNIAIGEKLRVILPKRKLEVITGVIFLIFGVIGILI